MEKRNGMLESDAEGVDVSLPPSNIVAFPYRQAVEKAVGLGLLLEAREDLLQLADDMAILNNLFGELRRLALLSQEIMGETGQTIQSKIAEIENTSRPLA